MQKYYLTIKAMGDDFARLYQYRRKSAEVTLHRMGLRSVEMTVFAEDEDGNRYALGSQMVYETPDLSRVEMKLRPEPVAVGGGDYWARLPF